MGNTKAVKYSKTNLIVDTIKDLTTTEYNIDKETIKNGLVPSNQLLIIVKLIYH